MMCRMEELQQNNSNGPGHHMHLAMPIDATERPPSCSTSSPPLLLDVSALSILHPAATVAVAAAAIDVTRSAESPHARFSPVPPSQLAQSSSIFATAVDRCAEEEESPMPSSFVSPALRSPDLLSIHHFQKEENGVDERGLSEEEAAVDPMEGCELNLASIDSTSTDDDNITVSDDREGNLCSPDSNHTSTVQDSPTENESETAAKANRRLSVSDRVAAVERAITTSSSGNGSVVIPVPPPIAAVMHRRGSAPRKTDNMNQTLIPVDNNTT